MSIQDVQILIAQARLEADNPAFKVCGLIPYPVRVLIVLKAYFPLYVCIGKKPRSR
jgi:hypothetical protein